MRSLQQILKDNGQDPNQAYQVGKFEFCPKAGCLVYQPPGMSRSQKESSKAA